MKKPKYQHLAEVLRVDIEPMEDGAMLMKESEMISHYEVSRNTLRHAMSLLREDGLIMSKAGFGTLRSKKSRFRKKSLQVVMPSRNEPFWYTVMEGLFDGIMEKKEYQLVYSYGGDESHLISRTLQDVLQSDTDGLIYLAQYEAVQVNLLNEIAKRIPTVLAHNRIMGFEGPFVGSDERKGIEQLIEHLMESGCRDIHFFSGANCSSHRERRQAYLELMDQAGLAVKLHSAGTNERDAYEFARKNIGRSLEKGSAMMCVNDRVACGLINAFVEAGWRIPEDAAVTGFGALSPLGPSLDLSLCTIDQRPFELGRQAMSCLLNQIHGDPYNMDLLVRGRFVLGDSVAKAMPMGGGQLHV
jgi:DNA-binding LacI/PurR family transcriptional regulator